jgi:hypothetical protein
MMLPISASAPLVNLEIPEKIVIQGNTLKGIAMIENPLKFGNLLSCLVEKESQGKENARGDCGEIGCLQFLPRTFNEFCVNKYRLAEMKDIKNCEIQKRCADLMIRDGYLKRWTTWKYCWQNWY